MGRAAVEAVVDRWLNERAFRTRLRREPETVIAEMDLHLSEHELAAVRSMDAQADLEGAEAGAGLPTVFGVLPQLGVNRPPAPVSSPAERVRLLAATPVLALLPTEELEALATEAEDEAYGAGESVVVEGDEGRFLFIIVSGEASVFAGGAPHARDPLARLGPGHLFGELALAHEGGRRRATVVAVSPLHTLTLRAAAVVTRLAAHPEALAALRSADARAEASRLLSDNGVFAGLDAARLQAVRERLTPVELATGELVMRQGDAPDFCYIVQRGQVEVVAEGDTGERVLATLGPGALFGEMALLTGAPRNSSVRVVGVARLLRMDGADLLELIRDEHEVADSLHRLTTERSRPARAPGVEVAQPLPGGTETALTDTRSGQQFRLSGFGAYVWHRMNGERTARDISIDYFEEFGVLAPLAMQQVVRAFLNAGLATPGVAIAQPVPPAPGPAASSNGAPWLRYAAIGVLVALALAALRLLVP